MRLQRRFQADGRVLAGQHAADFIAGQSGQPGEDVPLGPVRLVAAQVADRPQHRLLHDFLAEVAVAADAIEAEAVERLQGGLGKGVDRLGVPGQAQRCQGLSKIARNATPFLLRAFLAGTRTLLSYVTRPAESFAESENPAICDSTGRRIGFQPVVVG